MDTPSTTPRRTLLAGTSALALTALAPMAFLVAGAPGPALAACFTGAATGPCDWSGAGTLTNGGTISGGDTGVTISSGAVGTLSNTGTISVGKLGVIIPTSVGADALTNTGSLHGESVGVQVGGTLGALTNSGTISGNSAIQVNGTLGTLTNTGAISGYQYSVLVNGTLGTLTNGGTISSNTSGLYVVGTLGTLTNSGTITGNGRGVFVGGAVGTLINSGVFNNSGAGIYVDGTIDGVTNGVSGILSSPTGVMVNGTIGTLTNSGTISNSNYGIVVNSGTIGTLTNTGLISSALYYGIWLGAGTIDTLTNSGTIRSDAATAVFLPADLGTLTNSGIIFGHNTGLYFGGSLGALTNSGTISGGTNGLYGLGTLGTLTNSGTISGGAYAIKLEGSGTIGALVNSGVISGTILNLVSSGLTISGGGSSVGTFTGYNSGSAGLIDNQQSDVVLAGGTILLNDDVRVTGHALRNTGATLQLNNSRSVNGDYAQGGAASLVIGAGSTNSYGKLTVSGTASMPNGKVALVPVGGFNFAVGQTFTIVDAGTIAGTNYTGVTVTGTNLTASASALIVGGHDDLVITITGITAVASGAGGGGVDTSRPFYTLSDLGTGRQLVFNGGTLKITATTSTSQTIVIGVTGGTIDNNGNLLTLTGAIDNTSGGTLTFGGGGQVVLTSTMTGGMVQISGGQLSVDGTVIGSVSVDTGGILRGLGLINGPAVVAGTLQPGGSPGTLRISGPVTMMPGGGLVLDIDGTGTGTGAGNYSRVIVSGGNIFTAAGTLAPKLRDIGYSSAETPGTNSYTPPLGQKFAGVVQADGGILGSFDRLTQPAGLPGGTRFDAVYGSTAIDLYVTPARYGNLPAAGVAQTRNQSSLGSALDTLRPAAGTRATGEIKTLFDALAPLGGGALPDALGQLAGQIHPQLPATAVEVGRTMGGALSGRFEQLHGDELAERAQSGLTRLAFRYSGGQASGGGRPPSGLAGGDKPASPEGWTVWARGVGSFVENGGDGNNPGFQRDTGGAVVGADRIVAEDLRAGLDLGYARGVLDARQGGGTATTDSYRGGAYASWTPGRWFVDGRVGGGLDRFDTKRTIQLGALGRAATSSPHSHDVDGELRFGTRWALAGFTVEPDADLRYDRVSMPGYTEAGAGALGLKVDGGTHQAIQAGLGVRVAHTYTLENGLVLEPDLKLRWEHEALDPGYRTTESLAGAGFSALAAKPGRDAAVAGAGIAAVLNKNLKFYGHYDAESRANQTGHTITGGMKYTW